MCPRAVACTEACRSATTVHAGAGGSKREAVDRAVDAFPILGDPDRPVGGTLSGGQQQMLAMAVAHVRDPQLLLVDEASLGLGPIVVDEIFSFLERCTALGVAPHRRPVRAPGAGHGHDRVRPQQEDAFEGRAADLLGSDLFEQYLDASAA